MILTEKLGISSDEPMQVQVTVCLISGEPNTSSHQQYYSSAIINQLQIHSRGGYRILWKHYPVVLDAKHLLFGNAPLRIPLNLDKIVRGSDEAMGTVVGALVVLISTRICIVPY